MNLTPAMQQYYDIKKEYNDCIIFFRMGDFYEMFWDDAHIAHKVLWIAITTRNKNAKNPEALAWFPFHAKEKYLPLFIKSWYKVAIVEQVSDPKLKWIVKREVVRVVTPSTLSLEWEEYKLDDSSNYLVSISQQSWRFWISFIDFGENKWRTWEFEDFDSLKWQLYKISPKEVILQKSLFSNTKIKDILSKKYSLNIYYFEYDKDPYKKLTSHFWVKNLKWFWLDWKNLACTSSAQLLSYVELNQKSNLSFLDSISYLSFSWFLDLDESTIRNLDLIYNFSTKSSSIWTLFGILNKTKTSMWTRFLRESILYPLNDIYDIKKRQDFVSYFYENRILLDKIRDKLSQVSDIDSILNRLSLNRSWPRDLLNLKKSLISALEVMEILNDNMDNKLKESLKKSTK